MSKQTPAFTRRPSPSSTAQVACSNAHSLMSTFFLIAGFFLGVLTMQWTDPLQLSNAAQILMEQVQQYVPSRPTTFSFPATLSIPTSVSSPFSLSSTTSTTSAGAHSTISKSNYTALSAAWSVSPESCTSWVSLQRDTGAYVDAYVIGSQKGATSQLSKHLHLLGVRRPDMRKEWHFFNTLNSEGRYVKSRTIGQPLPSPLNLTQLRTDHFLSGFPSLKPTTELGRYPKIDSSAKLNRSLVIDMTVEYLHSERSAFLAHALTPHSKIIVTIRDPLARALSQYNMVVRNGNAKRRAANEETIPATAESFDTKVRAEVQRLKECGYDSATGIYKHGLATASLAQCMLSSPDKKFDDMLYVTRGLYHLHIAAWLNHFPAHHTLIMSFKDIAGGSRFAYEQLTQFLCIRDFPETLLRKFEAEGSELSFGQQAAKEGLKKAGFDTYEGNDRYLPEMKESTRSFLTAFYSAADEKLKLLVGQHFVYW